MVSAVIERGFKVLISIPPFLHAIFVIEKKLYVSLANKFIAAP